MEEENANIEAMLRSIGVKQKSSRIEKCHGKKNQIVLYQWI